MKEGNEIKLGKICRVPLVSRTDENVMNFVREGNSQFAVKVETENVGVKRRNRVIAWVEIRT
jgi:hypothetical protein